MRELIEAPRTCILCRRGTQVNGEVVDGVWLVADLTIVLLLLAGNHVRQSAPARLVIMSGAVVVFVERFLWPWYVSGLNAEKSEN